MNIMITGATGLLGQNLVKKLVAVDKHKMLIFSRDIKKAQRIFDFREKKIIFSLWDYSNEHFNHILEQIELFNVDVIINLVGENIGEGNWTNKKKEQIVASRVKTGELLCTLINKMTSKRPKIFMQASAIAIDTHTEKGEKSFLKEVVKMSEESTQAVEKKNINRIIFRLAPVLSSRGGFLKNILPIFKYALGTKIGRSSDWFSWIHIEDATNAIIHLMNANKSGIFEVTSPTPVTNHEFYHTLAKTLHRPLWPVNINLILKMLFKEKAEEVIFKSTKVFPQSLIDSGFIFLYPKLEDALKDIIKNFR
ncbi:MAG: TIGR01777 family protein [Oligoflexia bacterium]|nr:TIGR01777 family protein [Oligoflexia bacterium]